MDIENFVPDNALIVQDPPHAIVEAYSKGYGSYLRVWVEPFIDKDNWNWYVMSDGEVFSGGNVRNYPSRKKANEIRQLTLVKAWLGK